MSLYLIVMNTVHFQNGVANQILHFVFASCFLSSGMKSTHNRFRLFQVLELFHLFFCWKLLSNKNKGQIYSQE